MKLISKTNCPRCESIKNFLDKNNFPYEVEMAEDKGYGYWRDFVTQKTGTLGFPILLNGDECVNGSSEDLLQAINKWFVEPTSTYFWGK